MANKFTWQRIIVCWRVSGPDHIRKGKEDTCKLGLSEGVPRHQASFEKRCAFRMQRYGNSVFLFEQFGLPGDRLKCQYGNK